ncbi:Monocarboxylate transporter 3 [Fusarium oxysporum f. sp. albedinis]|nr:Monocarboxylate transporter 3 [Fusarium oxysporum f. sp. albedinis]
MAYQASVDKKSVAWVTTSRPGAIAIICPPRLPFTSSVRNTWDWRFSAELHVFAIGMVFRLLRLTRDVFADPLLSFKLSWRDAIKQIFGIHRRHYHCISLLLFILI